MPALRPLLYHVPSSGTTTSPCTRTRATGTSILVSHEYTLVEKRAPEIEMQAWLEGQKPRFMLHPAQKSCIEQALKFLPKLKEGLAKHTSAESDDDVPEPAFQSDDDF